MPAHISKILAKLRLHVLRIDNDLVILGRSAIYCEGRRQQLWGEAAIKLLAMLAQLLATVDVIMTHTISVPWIDAKEAV